IPMSMGKTQNSRPKSSTSQVEGERRVRHLWAGYIEHQFRRYLECGILAHGFARARCDGCGHDFPIAFSCQGRGVCPSCNARRMAETAAHLVDHVFPRLPVRQWVVSFPKWLRYFLKQDPAVLSAALGIVLRIVERSVRASCPGAGPNARIGAVAFIHQFGSSLNEHIHFHIIVVDGVFEPSDNDAGVVFFEATALDESTIAEVQATIRRRVLKAFVRRGLLDQDERETMEQWAHGGGFSIDAQVRIEGHDRQALERLLRYCARPPFALERIEKVDAQHIVYHLPKPKPDGRTTLTLTPLELIDLIVGLVPRPRAHRHRYFGVLAPNATLRVAVTALAPVSESNSDTEQETTHP
ncbi:MAG: transposase, partial [bacterium]|nr:transposase [bacterium]